MDGVKNAATGRKTTRPGVAFGFAGKLYDSWTRRDFTLPFIGEESDRENSAAQDANGLGHLADGTHRDASILHPRDLAVMALDR